jgi:hypothetical protein
VKKACKQARIASTDTARQRGHRIDAKNNAGRERRDSCSSLLYSQPGFTVKTPRDFHDDLMTRAA